MTGEVQDRFPTKDNYFERSMVNWTEAEKIEARRNKRLAEAANELTEDTDKETGERNG